MLCHGELVRLKPDARRLTSFYLMISAGVMLFPRRNLRQLDRPYDFQRRREGH